MNTEKAIEIINGRIEFGKREYSDVVPEYIEALELALEALRKQEPVKPKEYHIATMYHGWHYQSPEWAKACGMNKYLFCPRCGQAIDWE